MSILERLRAAFTPVLPDERALTYEKIFGTGKDTVWWTSLAGSGEPVTSETIMRAAAGACVRLLADDISSLPLDVYRKSGDDSEPIARPDWLDRPSGMPFDDVSTLISDIVVSMASNGTSFLYALPSVFEINYIEALDPDQTTVEVRDGARIWRNYEKGGVLGAGNVVQIDWLRRPGALRGLSPIDGMRESSGTEMAAEQWAGAFFKNGGTTGGNILVPGGPETVDAAQLAQQWQSRHSGPENWWKPSVLTGGATYDDTTPTPKEADLGPLFQRVVEAAARFYHIPPHLLGSQMAGAVSYASVEQRSIEYVQHAVIPFTTRIERVLSRLVPGEDTFVKLNTNALMRGDAKTRAEYYQIMTGIKAMKPATVAALEDLPADEAVDGWLETPNNNGTGDAAPADEGRALSIDTVTIGDDSAERIADTAAAGAAVAAAEARKLAESVSEDVKELTAAVRDHSKSIATLRDDRKTIEALLASRAAPPDIRIDGDFVYYQRGNEVERKKVTRDERGHVIGMVAA